MLKKCCLVFCARLKLDVFAKKMVKYVSNLVVRGRVSRYFGIMAMNKAFFEGVLPGNVYKKEPISVKR